MNARRIIAAVVSTVALLAVNVGVAETASAKGSHWSVSAKGTTAQTAGSHWS